MCNLLNTDDIRHSVIGGNAMPTLLPPQCHLEVRNLLRVNYTNKRFNVKPS